MNKFVAALALTVGMFGLGMTGCGAGGGGETSVVETATVGGELPPDQQQSYEEAMKAKQGPGN